MTNEDIEIGASILLRVMREFYQNKENMAKFEEWKMQKEANENG